MERGGKRRTLRAFAEELGVGQSTLDNYLKGRDSKASFIKLVCQKTGCDANWLLGLTTDKDTNPQLKLAMLKMHIEARVESDMDVLRRMLQNDNHRKANEKVYEATKGALRPSEKDESGHFIEKT
jgi:transcriptional regulator with XRE-family HTH domain